jgi:hypothetical protein
MCFSIIVGLGLDYDVFLVTRILEYRMEAHTDQGQGGGRRGGGWIKGGGGPEGGFSSFFMSELSL